MIFGGNLEREVLIVGEHRRRPVAEPGSGRAGSAGGIELQRAVGPREVGLDELAQEGTSAAIPPVGLSVGGHPAVLVCVHGASVAALPVSGSTSFAAVNDEGRGAAQPNVRGAVCVVTGGFGFIGSNLTLRLVAAGAEVRVIDALVPSHGGDERNIGALDVDRLVARISDPRCGEIVDGADLIFNVAGQVSHTASMIDPRSDLELNALDHAEFLETVRVVNPTAR